MKFIMLSEDDCMQSLPLPEQSNILTVALVDHCVTQSPHQNVNFVYEWQKKENNLWSSYVHLNCQAFPFGGN